MSANNLDVTTVAPSTTTAPDIQGIDLSEYYLVGQAVGSCVLCVWAVLANLVLILSILRSENRRKVSFNLHVCNLSLVGIGLGGFILPLYTDQCLQEGWVHDDNLCRVRLMAEMLVCTVSVLIVLMMVFDRFVLFSCPEAAEGICKFVLSAMLIILPWALGFALIIPIYVYGETGYGVDASRGLCFLDMHKGFIIATQLAGYAVPTVAAFGLLVATSLTWCVRREELREMEYSAERDHTGWQVIMSWIIVVAVLGMWFPLPALRLLTYLIPETFPTDWYIFATWIGYANSGLNPILWMLMPRLRQSVAAFCCCCCGCCPCSRCCRRKDRGYKDEDKDDETGAAMIEIQ